MAIKKYRPYLTLEDISLCINYLSASPVLADSKRTKLIQYLQNYKDEITGGNKIPATINTGRASIMKTLCSGETPSEDMTIEELNKQFFKS